MTTKMKELDAVERIRQIVKEVGGDESYIGMAMGSVLEIAEENIRDDFGDSLQSVLLSKATELMKDKMNALENKAKDMSEARDRITKDYNDLMNKHITTEHALADAESRNACLDAEITRLKAMLWDYKEQMDAIKAELSAK